VFTGKDGRSGVENVEHPLPLEDRERVDPVRELCIIVVAGTADEVVSGDGTSEARAVV
jgi:hypothetical protein